MLLIFLRLWFNTVLAKVVVFPWFATYCNAFIAKPVAFQYFCFEKAIQIVTSQNGGHGTTKFGGI